MTLHVLLGSLSIVGVKRAVLSTIVALPPRSEETAMLRVAVMPAMLEAAPAAAVDVGRWFPPAFGPASDRSDLQPATAARVRAPLS